MLPIQFYKKNRESGQGLVEYAIVLPIFLMIVFFLIDFSTVLYDKVAFNMALRESIFDIDFSQDDIKYLQGYLNPFGSAYKSSDPERARNRYGTGLNPYNPYEFQDRAKYFYMNDLFLNGDTVEDYLKKQIKAKDNSIDVDRIQFKNFEEDRESMISIMSGLQHYNYKKELGSDGLDYSINPKFSTIVMARIRVAYTIEPRGAFMKTLYPNGIPHEKVIYKSSRNFRWTPSVVNPDVKFELTR